MKLELRIANRNRVNVVDLDEDPDDFKHIAGEAYRSSHFEDWFVGARAGVLWPSSQHPETQVLIGRVHNANVPEVVQRKIILAMLTAAFGLDVDPNG
jgi:hypothetical protein